MSAALTEILTMLERIAPLTLAEPWDNVGLLLEPTPATQAQIEHALLTIDLADDVVEEAEALGARLIVAYHPPIFQGLKRLRSSVPAERALLRCAAQGIAIYSPHTALDAVVGGVNDWLLEAFGAGQRGPCLPHPTDARAGQGRYVRLEQPLELSDAVTLIKRHLSLKHVRVSPALTQVCEVIRSVAVCAGSGGSLFEKLGHYDLLLSGEMRHHDVRARSLQGSNVILCEHTNTERGYLPVLAQRLGAETIGPVTFHVSQCDRDPLSIA